MRVPLRELREGSLRLPKEVAHYLTRVHRLRPGATVTAFDPVEKTEAPGVLRLSDGDAYLDMGEPRASTRLPKRQITLIQCVGKGDKIDQIVRDATELGVTSIRLAESERSVARKSSEQARQRYEKIALEAARQAGRGDVPSVTAPRSLEAELRATQKDRGAVLSPDASQSFRETFEGLSPTASLALVIGPEGGLSPSEVALAGSLGFQPTRLGWTVLRTETVAAATLGALMLLE